MTVNRIPEFPYMYAEYLEMARRGWMTAPVVLGGTSGSSGGSGGPPGGFIGQLPQRSVAYDTTEAATLATSSGSSLLDNLNHIRYLVAQAQFNAGVSGAEFAQVEYATADISLGLVTDVGWVDVDLVNAVLPITPQTAGTFQATFGFAHDVTFTGAGPYVADIWFRLTDGVTSVAAIRSDNAGAGTGDANVINLSGLFTWTDTLPKTVWLQKWNVALSGGPVTHRIVSGGGPALHMDVFRLGGGGGSGSVGGSGAAGQAAFWTSGSALSGSGAFLWSNSGSRLTTRNLTVTSGSMIFGTSGFVVDAPMRLDASGATTNQVLSYNGTKWVPVSVGGAGGTVTGSGVAPEVTYWTSGSVVGSATGLEFYPGVSNRTLYLWSAASTAGVNFTVESATSGSLANAWVQIQTDEARGPTGGAPYLVWEMQDVYWAAGINPRTAEFNLNYVDTLKALPAQYIPGRTGSAPVLRIDTSGSTFWSANKQVWDTSTIQFDSSMRLAPSGATTNQVLAYDGTKWVPATPSAGGGSLSGSGAVSQVAYWTSGSVLAGSPSLTWDSSGSRLTVRHLTVTSGSILLGVNGLVLDAPMRLDPTAAVTNQVLTYTGTKWVPSLPAAIPLSGSGVAGQATFWTSGSNLSGSSAFLWDNSGSRLTVRDLTVTSGSMIFGTSGFRVDAPMRLDTTGAATSQILTYDGTKWIPATPTAPVALSGSGAAGQATFWTSGSNLSGSSAFLWDNSGSRLTVRDLTVTSGSMLLGVNGLVLDAPMRLSPAGAVTSQILTYDGVKWIPATPAAGPSLGGSGAAGQVAFFTSGSLLSSSSKLTHDHRSLTLTSGSAGVSSQIGVFQTDLTNSSSHAIFLAQTSGSGGGDPVVQLAITSGSTWSMGVDNSNLDTFKIGFSPLVGTNSVLLLSSGSIASFTGDVNVAGGLNVGTGVGALPGQIQTSAAINITQPTTAYLLLTSSGNLAGNNHGVIEFWKNDASAGGTGVGATITAFDDSANGTKTGLRLATQSGGSNPVSPTTRLTISGDGDLTHLGGANFGTATGATAGRLYLSGATNNQLKISSVETDATRKNGMLVIGSFTNAQQPLCVFYGDSEADGTGSLNFGGGTSVVNGVGVLRFYTASAVNTATGTLQMSVLNNGNIEMTSKVTKYLNVATVGAGVGSLVATVDLTGQGAAIASTTLYAVPAAGAGMYLVSSYAKVTTAAGTSSTLGGISLGWTDATDSVVQSNQVPAQVPGPAFAYNTNGNATSTTFVGMPMTLWAKASTNITYTFGYVSNAAGAMKYELHIKVEYLG